MITKHTPEEVANSLKEIIKQKYGSLSEYAHEKKITPTQLYNLLSGKEYITLFSAVRLCNDFDLNTEYCTKGILPMYTSEHDYNELKKVAIEFFYAVKEEDDFRDNYKNRIESLSLEELSDFNSFMNKLRIKKAKAASNLIDLLNLGFWEDFKETNKQTYLKPTNSMTLHEAIEEVLRNSECPLTFSEIATTINQKGLYSRKDGRPVPASQISARIKNYPHLFTVNREMTPQTINLSGN